MVLKKKDYDTIHRITRNLEDYEEISGITKKFRQIFVFFFNFLRFLGQIINSFYEKEEIQVIFC